MLKVLVRKQLFELFRGILYDKKHNTMRSKGAVAGFAVLFLCVGLSVAMAFVGMGELLSTAFFPLHLEWLYFAFFGLIALLVGTLGSVFITVNTLYHAKDNDLLLSMPVPVKDILVSRILTVYLTDAAFSLPVLLPALILYYLRTPQTVLTIISSLLFAVLITLVSMVLCCGLGWLVARISLHIRNKSVATTILTVILVGGYYLLYFNINTLLNGFVTDITENGIEVAGLVVPLYHFGNAAAGSPLSMVIFAAVALALAGLVWWLLKRSFIRIVTTPDAVAKSGEVLTTEKVLPLRRALLRRELKHFTSSAVYMTNCGPGILLLPAAGIFLLVKGGDLVQTLGDTAGFLPAIAVVALAFLAGMNDFTAPSVSLEGKTMWIAQTIPVESEHFLRAKLDASALLFLPPLVIATVLTCLGLGLNFLTTAVILGVAVAMQFFMSGWGLMLGLKHADLQWTNEVYPIKQSLPTMAYIFGSWGLGLAVGGVGAVATLLLGEAFGLAVLALAGVLLAIGAIRQRHWLYSEGANLFATL